MKMKSNKLKRKGVCDAKRKGLMIFCLVIMFFLIVMLIRTSLSLYEAWKTERLSFIGCLIIATYLYPFLYSFIKEVQKKDNEIKEILLLESETNIEKKLEVFDFYTLPKFFAELLKQFSSLWLFIFVQIIFLQLPEFEVSKEVVTMQVYGGFIGAAIIMSLIVYLHAALHFLSISTESFSRKRHIKYLSNLKKYVE